MKLAGYTSSNRLLPIEPSVRPIAEHLYNLVADLPIISPHGHVEPKLLYADEPFQNPAELFIYFDHYVTRLLHANGTPLEQLRKPSADPNGDHARNAWSVLCKNWHLFGGTASGYWLGESLEQVFGIEIELSEENAQVIYDLISKKLLEAEFRPRALFERFKISVLATTDDPIDDLSFHRLLAADSSFKGRVVPTFRPDSYIDPTNSQWVERVQDVCALTQQPISHLGLVNALKIRREYFKVAGAVSVDIGTVTAFTTSLSDIEAERIFKRALKGKATPEELLAYRGNFIYEMAKQSCEDGLVITLHVGVFRNHSSETLKNFGRDTGHDIPISSEFTKNLRPLLESFGLHPNFHLILFSLDETTFSREVAPLAGFYPSVFIGAPWWFLDAPHAILRFREAVTETAGFYRGSGFIDDTRAFLSIPARHDMSRRVDCSYLASLVAAGRLSMSMAEKIAVDLVTAIPKRAFKL